MAGPGSMFSPQKGEKEKAREKVRGGKLLLWERGAEGIKGLCLLTGWKRTNGSPKSVYTKERVLQREGLLGLNQTSSKI